MHGRAQPPLRHERARPFPRAQLAAHSAQGSPVKPPTTVPPSLRWLGALREPQVTLSWSLPQWERVVRLARRLRLLGRLAESVEAAGLSARVPEPVARHLVSEMQYARWRTGHLLWALQRLPQQLGAVDYPLVLLKGAAYIGQDLAIATGRLPSDVDILVPRQHIADAQARLVAAGWAETELDEHDRQYYHQWSHEVPPMRHALHGLELDLHHNILPPIGHAVVDAALLLARLQDSRWPEWKVLHPQDQVLHSAAHLFGDSEVRDRVRDLVDLDSLLRDFSSQADFWVGLPDRAEQLGLTEPLALACHFAQAWLQTPIPLAVQQRLAARGPGPVRRAWLLPLLRTVLMPTEPDDGRSWRQGAAAQIFLMRYHYRRMPLRILLPHLWHKLRAQKAAEADPTAAAQAGDKA